MLPEGIKPLIVSADVPALGHAKGLPDDVPALSDASLAPSRMLLDGTPDEATENEYVVALGAKIVQHACRMMPMKMKFANGSHKKVPVLVLNEHALAHVLKVMFSGAEVTDEALTWYPDAPREVLVAP